MLFVLKHVKKMFDSQVDIKNVLLKFEREKIHFNNLYTFFGPRWDPASLYN